MRRLATTAALVTLFQLCALGEVSTIRARTVICAGDCSSDGAVTINELLQGVNIALGNASVSECPNVDVNGDFEVTVNELVSAVGNALEGCPLPPTPTHTAVPATPTATATPPAEDQVPPTSALALRSWLQEGRYRSWHAESAPHPSGGPHGGTVRTYLNEAVFNSLAAGNPAHPRGAAVVKELYFDGTTVGEWAVEIKIQDDSARGNGWYWYEGVGLAGRGLPICTGCHGGNFGPYVSKDFVLTPFPLR